jgi:hypothetical protein
MSYTQYSISAVVLGEAHPKNYTRDYGVFISPKTELVY